jgi:hypothetical protein
MGKESKPRQHHYIPRFYLRGFSNLGSGDTKGLTRHREERLPVIELINKGRRRYGLDPEEEPVCSHIVAIAMLVDCVEKSPSPWWIKGEKGWMISGVVPIVPVPWTGGLSFWPCKFKFSPLMKMH